MPRKKPDTEAAPPPLRLEWRSPAELAENPRNWRTHPAAQVAALTDALAEVGWAGACLYNERTHRLIDGHARKKVALDQGADKVPVLVGNWTEAQEALILATLDPLAAAAGADAAALDSLLRDVQTGSQALGDMLTRLAEEAKIIAYANGATAAGGEAVDDPLGEWQDMPAFDNPPSAAQHVNCYFATRADVEAFAKLKIGRAHV